MRNATWTSNGAAFLRLRMMTWWQSVELFYPSVQKTYGGAIGKRKET